MQANATPRRRSLEVAATSARPAVHDRARDQLRTVDAARQTGARASTAGCLWRAFRWLDEALGHLEVIRPVVAHRFALAEHPHDSSAAVSTAASCRSAAARLAGSRCSSTSRCSTGWRTTTADRAARCSPAPRSRRRSGCASAHARVPLRRPSRTSARVVRYGVFHGRAGRHRRSVRFEPDYDRQRRRRSRCATSTASSRCRSSSPPTSIDEAALEDLVQLHARRAERLPAPRAARAASGSRRPRAVRPRRCRRRAIEPAPTDARARLQRTQHEQHDRHGEQQQHDHREPAVARALRAARARAARRRMPAAARAAAGGGGAAARAAPRRCTAPRRAGAAAAPAGRSAPPSSARGTASRSTHRSRSGSSCRPRPSTLSSVFCSSTSCGWISTLKRRDARKSCSSTLPSEISDSGRSKIGSSTTRISASSSSTRVSGGHPARLDVRGRHAVVVAAEEREEVLREIALVALRQRAHDAEVERDVLAVVGAVGRDEDVARVHVGVEEAVAEHLREEDLDAGARQPLQVDARARRARSTWPIGMPAIRSITMHFAAAPVPVHRGHQQQRRMPEIAAQLRAVGRLARQVELVARASSRIRRRPRAAAGACRRTTASRPASRRSCISAMSFSITCAMFGRSTLTATGVPSGSSAKCTCATDALATGVAIERLEHLVDRLAVDAGQRRDHLVRRKRRHAILQLARARRRCRAAAGRAASTASGRT